MTSDRWRSVPAAQGATAAVGEGMPPLDDQAIQWVIHLHSGKATAADRVRLAAWLAESQEHQQAYAEAERLWAELGEAIDAPLPWPAMPGHIPRRLRQPWAAAAALLLAVSGWLLHRAHVTDVWLSDHYTGTGEQRRVALADGSRITLDTDSAVDVDFDEMGRRIRLRHGRALFQVAADAERPFEVSAGAGVTRALGTVFDVNDQAGQVRVTVQEHAVAVTAGADPRRPVRVEAGQSVSYSAEGISEVAASVDLSEATAWQRGKLIFRDLELSRVVGELNRYRSGKILLMGSGLEQLRVTGVFPIDDGSAALQTIQSTLALKATELGPFVFLHR